LSNNTAVASVPGRIRPAPTAPVIPLPDIAVVFNLLRFIRVVPRSFVLSTVATRLAELRFFVPPADL